jgi:hypothetical protein
MCAMRQACLVLLLHIIVCSNAFVPPSNFAGASNAVAFSKTKSERATRLCMSESSSSAADSSNNDGTVEDAPFQPQEKRRFRAKLIAGSAEVSTQSDITIWVQSIGAFYIARHLFIILCKAAAFQPL